MAESQSKEVYFLNQVANQKYNKDFAVNMVQLNNTVKSISKYLIVMQKGIDDLNRDIIEVIRDFIEEIIIIFNGGDLSNLDFEWGDLKYVLQAIGAFFGFPIWSDSGNPWSPLEMAQNFFENFIQGFIDFVSNLLGADGLIKGIFLPKVPVGQLTNDIVNLIDEGSFDSSHGGAASGTWYWSPTGGVSSSGSAALDSGSGLEPLFSNPVSFSVGDELEVTAKAKNGTVKIVALAYRSDESLVVRQESGNIVGTSGGFISGSMTFVVPPETSLLVISIEPVSFLGSVLYVDDWESVRNVDTIPDSWVNGLPDFIQGFLSIFGIFSLDDLNDAKLLDSFAPPMVQGIIDRIFNGFASQGLLEQIGRPQDDAMNTIYNLLGMSLQNSSQGASLAQRIRQLESAGNTISDDFLGAALSDLGPSWTKIQNVGSGGHYLARSGGGVASWSRPAVGPGNWTKTNLFRHGSQLTTDSWVVEALLASGPQAQDDENANLPQCWLCGGFSDSELSYVRLVLRSDRALVEVVVNNSATPLGTVMVAPKAGDIWGLQRGGPGGESLDEYRIMRNGQQLGSTLTDTGSIARRGVGNRGLGLGGVSRLANNGIFVFFVIPNAIDWISAYEILGE